MRHIGLLGGSFDPPHNGHVYISIETKKILQINEIWWLVTPQNPLKISQPATYQERIINCKEVSKNNHIKSRAPKSITDMLNILLKNTAETHNISTKLIGDKKDMEKLASGRSNTKILEGWRYDLFGKTALKFIEGKIAIISNNNKITLKKL